MNIQRLFKFAMSFFYLSVFKDNRIVNPKHKKDAKIVFGIASSKSPDYTNDFINL